jgi:hypothetical protein
MWNGTAETLKAKPTSSSPSARYVSTSCPARRPDMMTTTSSSLVVPATPNVNATP